MLTPAGLTLSSNSKVSEKSDVHCQLALYVIPGKILVSPDWVVVLLTVSHISCRGIYGPLEEPGPIKIKLTNKQDINETHTQMCSQEKDNFSC